MSDKPVSFSTPIRFHKAKTAIQLELKKKSDDICYWIFEAAPFLTKNAEGNNTYNWKEKISMKMDGNDLTKILYALDFGQGAKIYHDSPFTEYVTTLNINFNTDNSNFGFNFNMNGKDKEGTDVKRNVTHYLSPEEAYHMSTILKFSVPSMYGMFSEFVYSQN